MPTSAASACSSMRTPDSSSAYSASASRLSVVMRAPARPPEGRSAPLGGSERSERGGSRLPLQVLLEDQRCRGGVDVGSAVRHRLDRRVALVDLVHRQPEAAVQLA